LHKSLLGSTFVIKRYESEEAVIGSPCCHIADVKLVFIDPVRHAVGDRIGVPITSHAHNNTIVIHLFEIEIASYCENDVASIGRIDRTVLERSSVRKRVESVSEDIVGIVLITGTQKHILLSIVELERFDTRKACTTSSGDVEKVRSHLTSLVAARADRTSVVRKDGIVFSIEETNTRARRRRGVSMRNILSVRCEDRELGKQQKRG
jgi:hypothetical protein